MEGRSSKSIREWFSLSEDKHYGNLVFNRKTFSDKASTDDIGVMENQERKASLENGNVSPREGSFPKEQRGLNSWCGDETEVNDSGGDAIVQKQQIGHPNDDDVIHREFEELLNQDVFLGDRLSRLNSFLEDELQEVRVTHFRDYDRLGRLTAVVSHTRRICEEYRGSMGTLLMRMGQVRAAVGDIRATIDRKIEKEGLLSWLRAPESSPASTCWTESRDYLVNYSRL